MTVSRTRRDPALGSKSQWFTGLLLATTVLGVVSVLVHDQVVLVSLFVLGPCVAALSLDGPRTMVVAIANSFWALVVSVVADTFNGPGHGSGFATVVLVSLISTVAAYRRYERDVSLQRISMVAEAAQATIVRPIPSRLGSLTFATVYRSAAEEARVGGDAYAAVAHADGVRLLVADVRGKGLEAVGLAADVLASFREFAPGPVPLPEVARHLEVSIKPALGAEDFVTALLVGFTEDEIGLVSCGHPWPLLRHRGMVSEIRIHRPSPPLGLGIRPVLQTHRFGPGDQLLVFTDGLVEARNVRGSYFDPLSVLDGFTEGSPRELLDQLVTSLDRHAGGRLADDLAIVLAEYSEEPAGASLVEGIRVLSTEGVPQPEAQRSA